MCMFFRETQAQLGDQPVYSTEFCCRCLRQPVADADKTGRATTVADAKSGRSKGSRKRAFGELVQLVVKLYNPSGLHNLFAQTHGKTCP